MYPYFGNSYYLYNVSSVLLIFLSVLILITFYSNNQSPETSATPLSHHTSLSISQSAADFNLTTMNKRPKSFIGNLITPIYIYPQKLTSSTTSYVLTTIARQRSSTKITSTSTEKDTRGTSYVFMGLRKTNSISSKGSNTQQTTLRCKQCVPGYSTISTQTKRQKKQRRSKVVNNSNIQSPIKIGQFQKRIN